MRGSSFVKIHVFRILIEELFICMWPYLKGEQSHGLLVHYTRTNFIGIASLKVVEKLEEIKYVLRLRSLKTKKKLRLLRNFTLNSTSLQVTEIWTTWNKWIFNSYCLTILVQLKVLLIFNFRYLSLNFTLPLTINFAITNKPDEMKFPKFNFKAFTTLLLKTFATLNLNSLKKIVFLVSFWKNWS